MDELESLQGEWRQHLGRFMLAFGEIEYSIRDWLIHVPPQNQWPNLMAKKFVDKANAAKRILKESRLPAPLVERASVLADNAIAMAHDRNLVAHNPLHLSIRVALGGEFESELEIVSLRDPTRMLNLSDMTALATRAEQLAANFHSIGGEIHWHL